MLSLFGLSAAFHLYVGARLLPDLPFAAAAALLALLGVSAATMPLGLARRRMKHGAPPQWTVWAGLIFMGLFSSLFVGTVLRDLLLLAAWIAGGFVALPLPALARDTAIAVPALAIFASLVGFLNARRIARPRAVRIPVEGLPQGLEGFRIAQITDVHVGPTIKRQYLQGIVDAVNALEPHAVAITGDLVDGSVPELRDHVAPLAQLRSTHGTFFVTGNHEYYSGAEPWIAELRRLGIHVLMNEHVTLEHGGARLVMAGIPDHGAGHFAQAHRPDVARALRGAPPGIPSVLLAHQPRSVSGAVEAGVTLQLSGHTHGGQFLPWNFFVRFQQPVTAGLHRMGGTWLYVSRGTGYWGPPKRFGAPSEITLLQLVSAHAVQPA